MYQALYRKYRPQTFEDVVGQSHITDTLKAQLVSGKLSHAYLFTGTRGTGKTTCAKILAKAVNCTDSQDGNPCGICAACRSIDSGSCVDVLEIDAASNSGVDHVRALRDEAVYSPSQVNKRVYIVDEVHMLSTAAFNALLKIVEEPPEHLLFILATTELHKVPVTILSRCQRFSFRRLTPADIAQRLNYVAYSEGIDLRQDGTELLASLADGALRDGLSLLDQCAAVSGPLTADAVCSVLGLAGQSRIAEILEAVADGDTARALSEFTELYTAGKDLSAMISELSTLARDLLILRTAPKSGRDMISGLSTQEQRERLLQKLSPAQLLRTVNLLQSTASGFAVSANRRLDVELCLMELCSPALSLDASALSARIGRLEEALASGRLVAVPAPAAEPAPEAVQPPAVPDLPTPEPDPQAVPAPSETLPPDFWPEFMEKIKGEIPMHKRAFFSNGTSFTPRLKGNTLFLEARTAFDQEVVADVDLNMLSEKASLLLSRRVRVKLTLPGAAMREDDPMAELLEFGSGHGDIVTINQ